MSSPRAANDRPKTTVVAAAAASLLWALLLDVLLDLSTLEWNVRWLLFYGAERGFASFLISTVVVWLAVLTVLCLTNRLFLTLIVTLVGTMVGCYANATKIRLRQEPLYPSDLDFLRSSGFLVEMVSPWSLFGLALLVLALAAGLAWLGTRAARRYAPIRRSTHPEDWRALVVLRVAVLALTVTGFVQLSHFNSGANGWRQAYEVTGAIWAWWYQLLNYRRHGFIAGWLYNLEAVAMEEPADYTRATMQAIAARYADEAKRRNAGRDPHALDGVNVVLILSEAFSDPTVLDGITVAEDPIPYTRRLMSETVSGNMLAQLLGGGTANMEFEALTGQSLSQFEPQMNTPYQMLLTGMASYPSAVGYFERHGHDAVAIHPYLPRLYQRERVYPMLGFRSFIHDTTMRYTETIGRSAFVSDQSAFDETEYQIEKSDRPLLVNLITMQNHYPMAKRYDDPIAVTGVSGERREQAEGYARGLKHSDEAMRRFIDRLRASREKTVIVFYGDHLPAFWPTPLHANSELDMRRMPFFIWTNFRPLAPRHVPITSPIYLLPMVLNELGAELPPYYALLSDLQSEVLAMEQGIYYDARGEPRSLQELGPRARALLHDYRLVQYDLSIGRRWARDMFYSDSPADASAPSEEETGAAPAR